MDTAFVQTSLKEDHSIGSYEYMARVRERLSREMPELTTYFQAGGLVDSVINQGLPAPIDVQVSSNNMRGAFDLATEAIAKDQGDAKRERCVHSPGSELSRPRAEYRSRTRQPDRPLGKNVVDNVITALTSDGMVAPSYWIDPKTGNNYMVTVQYANRVHQPHDDGGFRKHSPAWRAATGLRPDAGRTRSRRQRRPTAFMAATQPGYTPLRSVAEIKQINTPTEVDHYQIRRVIDIYVATKTEALQTVGKDINKLLARYQDG